MASMNTTTRKSQSGLTMIGFLFVAAVLLVVALLVFRTLPAYIEFYTVQKALAQALNDTNDPTLNNVRRAVERKLDADYVDAVTSRDVEVTKSGNSVTATVSWQKKLPLFYNVSLVLDFDASATR
jgi:hypothetical protein